MEFARMSGKFTVQIRYRRIKLGTQSTGGQVDGGGVRLRDAGAQVRQVFGETRLQILSSQVHIALVGCGNACLHVGEVSGKLRLQSFGG